MAFQFGTTVLGMGDEAQLRLLKDVKDFMGGSHIGTVVINAGGSAYAQSDVGVILTLAGGTLKGDGNHPAEIEITEVNNGSGTGAVTAIRINNSGSFGIEPATLTGNTPTGSTTGSGLTVDIVMDSWATAVIAAGGTGYAVADILTVVGGTGTAMTFEVLTLSGSAVATVKPVNIGDYSVQPTNPVSTTVAPAGGTGCTLTLDRTGWLFDDDDYVDDQTEWEFWAHGANDAGSDPYVGIRTGTDGGNPQWMMAGATGYDGGQLWDAQPGTSPVTTFVSTANSARCPLLTSVLDYFLFVNQRRVIIVYNSSNTYEMLYLGLHDPFIDDPATKWPLPMYIAGSTHRNSETFASAQSTLHTCCARPATNQMFFRDTGGVWRQKTAAGSSPYDLWPDSDQGDITNDAEAQAPNIASGSGVEIPTGGLWRDNWYNSTPADHGYLNVGIGSRLYLLVPFTFAQDEVGALQVLGELGGVFKIPGRGIASEDIVQDQNGREHIVFPIINLSDFDDFYTIVME